MSRLKMNLRDFSNEQQLVVNKHGCGWGTPYGIGYQPNKSILKNRRQSLKLNDEIANTQLLLTKDLAVWLTTEAIKTPKNNNNNNTHIAKNN
jgi:hypothetical protein